MLPAVTRTATVAVTALALAAVSVAPAQALGKNERNFLKGVAAAVIVNELVKQSRTQAAPQPHDPRHGYDPRYREENRHRYDQRSRGDDWRYQSHAPQPPRQGYYTNVAADAFYEYSPQSRRLIQQRLAAYGYYRGAIDGIWGQGTASAMVAYARDVNASASLGSRDGSVRLYNALIG